MELFAKIRAVSRYGRAEILALLQCARAASGQAAAAPPSVAKNFRRAMWLAM
jgi:hypothetical protein